MLRFASRLSTSAFFAGAVPVLAFFVAAVRPATLFAEAAPPPPTCEAPEVATCADVDAGAACTVNGAPGTCAASLCREDAGSSRSALRCYATPKPGACVAEGRVAACAGKAVGDACEDEGECYEVTCPGDPSPTLVCGGLGGKAMPDGGPGVPSRGDDAGPGAGDGGSTTGGGTSGEAEATEASGGCEAGGGGASNGGGVAAAIALGAVLVVRARRRRAT